jgi:nucleoporin GLE1
MQGEHTVSDKSDKAFAIISIIVALYTEFPDFGKLVLGHFLKCCPYIVPMYVPEEECESSEDCYTGKLS